MEYGIKEPLLEFATNQRFKGYEYKIFTVFVYRRMGSVLTLQLNNVNERGEIFNIFLVF